MNQEIVTPFVEAVTEMMSLMVGTSCSMEPADLLQLTADVSGIVTLSGGTRGQVAVSMSRAVGANLVAQMLGVLPEELQDEELGDGVGEVANVIAGYAKARLAVLGKHYQLSLPSIVVGPSHRLSMLSSGGAVHYTVVSDFGSFTLSVWVNPESDEL